MHIVRQLPNVSPELGNWLVGSDSLFFDKRRVKLNLTQESFWSPPILALSVTMSHQLEIDLEFQPSLQRILVSNVNKQTTTVNEALEKFSEQAGIVRTSIKQAVPYCPVLGDLLPSGNFSRYSVTALSHTPFLGHFVPKPAPSHMPLNDVFAREGGLFIVDLEDESLKLLTPSRKWIFKNSWCWLITLRRSQTEEEEEEEEEESNRHLNRTWR